LTHTKNTEVEITPAMLAEGVFLLTGFDRERDDPEEALKRILLGLFEGSSCLVRFHPVREADDAQ
jgi:hypothetical protein